MKNIFTIFLTDFKRIKTNVVAVVIILGLIIVPALYAWFNILSNWDPYGEESTSKIKVAIASDDEGAQIEGIYFNMGDEVVSALESNNSIGWVFTDTTEAAIEGVYSGDYYAALVIPSEFTGDLISFLSEDVKHPEITYYENEKKNAIAPKITSKAKTTVQQQVNATLVSTLSQVMTKAVGTVMDTDEMATLGITEADTIVDVIIKQLRSAINQVDTFEALVDSFILVVDSLNETADAAENAETIDNTVGWGQSTLSGVQGSLNTGIVGQTSIARSLSASLASIQSLLTLVSETYEDAKGDLEAFNNSLQTMGINLHETKSLMTDMKTNLEETVEELEALQEDESYQMLMEIMTADPEAVGDFMASPVEIETNRIFPVENYGSAMASFYTVLAIWVESLFLVAIIHVGVHPIDGLKNVRAEHKYVGRYITFFLVGQVNAILTVLGNLYFCSIQCVEPLKLWFAGATASLVFTLLIYSLTFAFGNIGEAAAVIIMVIQVAGAGGTFPKEVLPDIFQKIYSLLPFPYAMDAMKEAVGGLYGSYYWECIGHLLLYIPVSVIIGLVLGKPFEKMNDLIEENKEGSGLML